MSWSPELYIGQFKPWPTSVHVVRGGTGVMWRYVPERTCHTVANDTGFLTCSTCGAVQPEDFTAYYCWSCGAKVVDE